MERAKQFEENLANIEELSTQELNDRINESLKILYDTYSECGEKIEKLVKNLELLSRCTNYEEGKQGIYTTAQNMKVFVGYSILPLLDDLLFRLNVCNDEVMKKSLNSEFAKELKTGIVVDKNKIKS